MTLHRCFGMRDGVIPLAVLVAVLMGAIPGRAAGTDPYLPEDTETLINLNVRQILDSALVKKHALEFIQEALKSNDQVQDTLKEFGYDPLKDLDRVLVAAPGGTDKDRGLVIVHGRFDLAKFKAKGEKIANNNGDNLKIQKVLGGKYIVYEINLPDLDTPLFVALAAKDTLLVSPGKDYVVAALKKIGKKEKLVLKNKDFQSLLEKIDDRQSVSVAAVKTDAVKDAVGGLPGDVKNMIDKIQALSGGLTLSDEIKLEVVITTKNAQEAKDLKDSADAGLKLALVFLAAFTTNQKDAKPGLEFALEIVKSLRLSNKGEAVVVKGRISSDFIEDVLKKGK